MTERWAVITRLVSLKLSLMTMSIHLSSATNAVKYSWRMISCGVKHWRSIFVVDVPMRKEKMTYLGMTRTPVREVELVYKEREMMFPSSPMTKPAAVAASLADLVDHRPHEVFAVVSLDVRLKPLGVHVVSMGTISTGVVHPREVFRTAIYLGASSIIIVHSHPSGESSPSDEDTQLTKNIVLAGQLVGIGVLDHIIIAGATHYSFHEDGKMPKAEE